MSNVKKALMAATALVLVAALSVGTTLALLKDTDSDVNVMTVVNVSIAQHEYERVKNADGSYKIETIDGGPSYVLKEFTQGKPLLPATELDANGNPYNNGAGNWTGINTAFKQVGANGGGMDSFTSENAVDKFVFVENTGKTDAYVRTIIAFEAGSLSIDEWNAIIKVSHHFSWAPEEVGLITIDNNNYAVLEFTYKGRPDKGYHLNGVLPAGEVSQGSLAQVYMLYNSTNEDVEAIDGNKNGLYDILVFSQACQAAGFDTAKAALDAAFGETTTTNHPWKADANAPKVIRFNVTNDAELEAVLSEIKNTETNWNTSVEIYLAEGTYSGEHTLYQYPRWNGKTGAGGSENNIPVLTGDEAFTNITFIGNSNVKFTGKVYIKGFGNSNAGLDKNHAYTVFKGVVFDGTNLTPDAKGDKHVVNMSAAATDVTFDNCTFKNTTHVVLGGSNPNGVGNISFLGCKFDNGGSISGYMKNLLIDDCTVNNEGGFVNIQNQGTVTVKGSEITCGKYAFRTSNQNVTIIANGTTFTVNEYESLKDLVNFRGSGHSATFTGCTITAGYTTQGVGTNGTLTIN